MNAAPRAARALAACAALLFAGGAAAADAEAGRRKAETCFACHGADGNPPNAASPSLAGQTPLYIYYQLLQFREERRRNEQMSPFAAKLTDADMKDIAAWFSAQKPAARAGAADPARVEAGRAATVRHHCNSCHMPAFTGQNHIPRLAGLDYEYLVRQMRGFKTGARPDIDGTMASAAQPVTDAEILDMAAYLAGLP